MKSCTNPTKICKEFADQFIEQKSFATPSDSFPQLGILSENCHYLYGPQTYVELCPVTTTPYIPHSSNYTMLQTTGTLEPYFRKDAEAINCSRMFTKYTMDDYGQNNCHGYNRRVNDFESCENVEKTEHNSYPEYQYEQFGNENNYPMVCLKTMADEMEQKSGQSTAAIMKPKSAEVELEMNRRIMKDNDKKVSSPHSKAYTPSSPSKYTKEQAEEMLDAPTIVKLKNFDVGKICEDMKAFLANNANRGQKGAKNYTQENIATHILGKSQGTFSGLIRNIPNWDTLQSGKHVYQRMYNWLNMSDEDRRQIWKLDLASNKEQIKAKYSGRVVLSGYQKTFLTDFFNRNSRPSRDDKHAIAVQLGLSDSTVHNWFANNKRRLNIGKISKEKTKRFEI